MCGIFGIRNDRAAAEVIYNGLHGEQHRAQEYTGICTSLGGNELLFAHGRGIVQDAIPARQLKRLRGHHGIGHIRYATTTDSDRLLSAQPIISSFDGCQVAIAHNGNITNYKRLKRKIRDPFLTSMDTEVILKLFCRSKQTDIFKRVHEAVRHLKGSYTLLFLFQDTLIAVRDPRGIRPLTLGKRNGSWIVASETVAIENVHAEVIRDIAPGEILVISGQGLESRYFDANRLSTTPLAKPSNLRHCIFELLYFAHPASRVFGISVAQWRTEVGARLADLFPLDADLVVQVPDSAMFFAEGYAQGSGIPLIQAITRSHYVGRTFIQPSKRARIGKSSMKYSLIRNFVKGKRVVLVDDSIVRLTTIPRLVRMLLEAGAASVDLIIATPPITGPCFYGIDTPEERELIAAHKSIREIQSLTGARSLHFLPLTELNRLSGAPRSFCKACMSGRYFDLAS